MTKINDLNTKDELQNNDKFVIWDGETRAITAQDAASYYQDQIAQNFQPADATLTAIAALPVTAGDYIEATGVDTFRARRLTVATYAALRIIPAIGRHEGMLVYVAARETAGDNGDGVFQWRGGNQIALVTSDPQSGLFVAPNDDLTGAAGVWVREIPENTLWVEWFGAKTNNAWPPTYPHTVWDTVAWQAALNLAGTNGYARHVANQGHTRINSGLFLKSGTVIRPGYVSTPTVAQGWNGTANPVFGETSSQHLFINENWDATVLTDSDIRLEGGVIDHQAITPSPENFGGHIWLMRFVSEAYFSADHVVNCTGSVTAYLACLAPKSFNYTVGQAQNAAVDSWDGTTDHDVYGVHLLDGSGPFAANQGIQLTGSDTQQIGNDVKGMRVVSCSVTNLGLGAQSSTAFIANTTSVAGRNENCVFQACEAVDCELGFVATGLGGNHAFTDCTAVRCTNTSFGLFEDPFGVLQFPDNCTFLNCTVEDTQVNFPITINGGSGHKILFPKFVDCDPAIVGHYIYLGPDTSNCLVIGYIPPGQFGDVLDLGTNNTIINLHPEAGNTNRLQYWTPSLVFGSNLTPDQTYDGRIGWAVRNGNTVSFGGFFFLKNKGAQTGNASIDGLPFSAEGIGTAGGVSITNQTNFSAAINFLGLIIPGARIDLLKVDAAGSANVTHADFDNNSALYFSGVYQASNAVQSFNDVFISGQGVAGTLRDEFDRQTAGAKLWTQPELPISGGWAGVTVARNGVGVAVTDAAAGTAAIRTQDWGRTWVSTTLPASRTWRGVCASGTRVIALATSGTDKGAYSFDGGSNWVESTLPSSGNWTACCHTDETTFVALRVGSASGARSTNGGATWSGITLPASRDWRAVASLGRATPATANTEILIAVANGPTDKAARSTDGGQTWAEITLPSSADWRTVVAFDNDIVCVLGQSVGARSTDGGANWTAISSFPTGVWRQASALSALRAIATDESANTSYIETINAGATWTVKTFPGSAVARRCNATPYRL